MDDWISNVMGFLLIIAFAMLLITTMSEGEKKLEFIKKCESDNGIVMKKSKNRELFCIDESAIKEIK
jgi:hypothetical protein